MSSIERLSLQGIRSFSPFDEEKIDFCKPLTLILGQNGAGKTTIIETLRTMTAGSMPPHTNAGKTFIHDPRISNLPETKAFMKLKFTTTSGKNVFALRSFQLMNKKNKQEFKKMEQVLKTKDEKGQDISINKNCMEMDRQVPMLMGVSNAILENVVFCHQDESLWPFSEQAHLKKIFDEIFDTTKYTKALVEMKATSKKYSKYAREFKQELDLQAKDFEQFTKISAQIVMYEQRIKDLDQKLKANCQLRENLKFQRKSFEQEESEMKERDSDLKHVRQQLAEKKQDAVTLETKLGFQNLNQDELDTKQQELIRVQDNYESEMAKLEHTKQEYEQSIKQIQTNVLERRAIQQEIQSKLQQNRNTVTEFSQQLEQLCGTITTQFKCDNNTLSVSDLELLLQQFTLDRNTQISQLQSSNSDEQQRRWDLELAINAEQTRYEIANQNFQSVQSQIDVIRGKQLHQGQMQHDGQEIERNLQQVMEQLCDVGRQLDEQFGIKTDCMQASQNALESADITANLPNCENEKEKLQHNLNQLTIIDRQITFQNNQLQTQEQAVKKSQRKQDLVEKFNKITQTTLYMLKQLGTDACISIDTDFQQVISKVQQACQSEGAQNSIKILQQLKEQLKIEDNQQAVMACVDKLVQLEAKKKETLGTVEKLISFSKEKSACFLCKQDLGAQGVQQMKKNFPTSDDQGKFDVKIKEARQQLVQSLQGHCSQHQQAKFIQIIDDQCAALKRQLTVASKVNKSEIVNNLISLQVLSSQIKSEPATQITVQNVENTKRNINELHIQRAELLDSNDQLTHTVEQITVQREQRQQLFLSLHLKYNNLVAQKYKILSKQKRALNQINDGNQNQLEDELLRNQQLKTQINLQISNIQQNLAKLKAQNITKQDNTVAQNRITQLEIQIEQLNRYKLELQNLYWKLEKNQISQQQIDDYQIQIAQTQQEQIDLERQLQQQEQQLKQIQYRMTSQPIVAQQIEMFQTLKRLTTEIQDKESKVNILSQLLANRAENLRKLQSTESEYQKVSSQCSMDQGQMQSLQQSLNQFLLDQKEPRFKDIEKKMLDLHVKYLLTRDLSTEMQEKHDALEEALMQYHNEKMKEINKTLSDFWKVTYKGEDIDTIMIKTDVDKQETARLKSYNYRIVLKTYDGTELDMKGRCSAGQKVLSSIIIRLALADTFCANCGILALDEPTTNLDDGNIEGLAQALLDIIESRRNSNNFQLVIITHDDQFIRVMGNQYAEYVCKIYKDTKGYSKILEQNYLNLESSQDIEYGEDSPVLQDNPFIHADVDCEELESKARKFLVEAQEALRTDSSFEKILQDYDQVYRKIDKKQSMLVELFKQVFQALEKADNPKQKFMLRKVLRIPSLIDILYTKEMCQQLTGLVVYALQYAFMQLETELLERIIEWMQDGEDFSSVCSKLEDCKLSQSQEDPYTNMYQHMNGQQLEIPESSQQEEFNINFLQEYLTSPGVVDYLANIFNIGSHQSKTKIDQAWNRLQQNVFQLSNSIMGAVQEIICVQDGCCYLSENVVQQLQKIDENRMLKFRIVTSFAERISFHFAQVVQLNEPQNKSIFGGKFNQAEINTDSKVVDFILDINSWYEPFSDTIIRKFPYLIQ